MNETAKKCVAWAVGLIVVGWLIGGWVADYVLTSIGIPSTPSGQTAWETISTIVSLVRQGAVTVGAVLIGAAVVINTLTKPPATTTDAPATAD